MRQAGTIRDAAQARLFADYLLTQGITSQVDETPDGYIVWIHDDAQLQWSRLELSEYLANPDSELYRDATAEADAIRRKHAKLRKQYARNVVDVRQRWRPWTEGRFPVTWILIVLSVGISLATHFGDNDWAKQWLYIVPFIPGPEGASWQPGLGLQSIREGQVWRLFTPAFLQVGEWLHMIFNMWWLYLAGALIETRRGSLAMIGITLATGIVSNVAQFAWAGPLFGGMSGVGIGLFSYIWVKSRMDPGAGIYAPPDLIIQFLIFLVLCMTGWIGQIANAAHVGGLLTGMAIALVTLLWRK